LVVVARMKSKEFEKRASMFGKERE